MKQCAMQRWRWNCCSITGGSAAEHAAGGDERRDAHEGREGEGMGNFKFAADDATPSITPEAVVLEDGLIHCRLVRQD